MKKVIETKNLSKSFGSIKALDKVSLSVEAGQVYGLLGPNGAGKSTMIKILSGEHKPTSGSAKVLGLDVTKDSMKIRQMIGIIPEQENPPSYLTAEEYLEFVCNVREMKNPKQKIKFWFDYLDFRQKDMLCKDLSRGAKQKLLVAQAFLHDPKLVLVDEPLVNMDPISHKKVRDYFANFVKKGNTIFLSTHVLDEADRLCKEAALIGMGKIIESGKISGLKKSKKETLEEVFLRLFMKK